MNDNLDDRLRAASPTSTPTNVDGILDRATRSRRRPLHEWMSTSTPSSRRAATSIAGAAVIAMALPLAFPAQQPLFSLGASAASSVNSASSLAGDEKMMMMPYVEYNYVADSSLSTAAGTGEVFRFELNGDVGDRAREVAGQFEVSGTANKATYFDEAYPTWVVGPEDGSAPSVAITWSGTGAWWYNNPAAYPETACVDFGQPGEAVGDDESLQCAEYAEPITGLNPSEADAAEIAWAHFVALGYSGSASDLITYRDEWGTTVTAPEFVNGQRIAVDWSMTWSGNGEIAYASGHSANVVSAGSFPTVSATEAVARLDDWRWFGSAPMDSMPWISTRAYDSVASDSVTTDAGDESTSSDGEPTDVATSEPADPGVTEPSETAEPTPEPTESSTPEVTPEPVPTLSVIDLIINKATSQLVLVWDNAGNAWLVPGYVLSGDEGWPMAVIALIDGIITLPEPMPIEPAIID